MSKEKYKQNNEKTQQRVVPFEPDSTGEIGSFHTIQSTNKSLLARCTEIQEMMAGNRQNRLNIHRQLNDSFRQFSKNSADQSQDGQEHVQIADFRQQIADLEQEHIDLHQQFIKLQAKFRQTVKDQRRQLVGTINKTRARTSRLQTGVVLFATVPDRQRAENDSSMDERSSPFDNRQYA